jgi:hypothetical protein
MVCLCSVITPFPVNLYCEKDRTVASKHHSLASSGRQVGAFANRVDRLPERERIIVGLLGVDKFVYLLNYIIGCRRRIK